MIEYIEVRGKNDRELIGIIDSFKSVIWHSTYYGVGDFEIYAPASERHINLLQSGNYITRLDDIEIGIIENISISKNAQDGMMIVASGRFAKSILDRRHIYNLSGKQNKPTILSGNVEIAARKLITNNAISCAFDSNRNIPILQLGALSNIPAIIVDDSGNPAEKQVSYDNLLEYSDALLQEYGIGAIITLDDETKKLIYTIYAGVDRSINNTAGNEAIIFSEEFDNLSESNYSFDSTNKKTAALIGGEGEGLDRFYALIAGTAIGFERRETWVDASGINKKYKDEQDVEHEYTDAKYKALIVAQGKLNLRELVDKEEFNGTLIVSGGIWRLNEDYSLGDIVTVEDKTLGKYADVRITEITEVQDENGYSAEIIYNS